MLEGRRRFLQTLGAALTIMTLPDVCSVNWFGQRTGNPSSDLSNPADKVTQLDLIIGRLLEPSCTSNQFVANAQERYRIYSGSLRLLAAPAAFLNIFDELGIETIFHRQPSFREASQCRLDFETHHEGWRRGFNSFTDVERAPEDPDVAYMLAGNVDPGATLFDAQGATQFRDNHSVSLSGSDAGIILAARSLLSDHYESSGKESAQSLALTNKSPTSLDNGQYGIRYETPVSSFVHVPTPYVDSRMKRNFRGGYILAYNKRDRRNPKNIYHAGLYV